MNKTKEVICRREVSVTTLTLCNLANSIFLGGGGGGGARGGSWCKIYEIVMASCRFGYQDSVVLQVFYSAVACQRKAYVVM